MVNLTPVLRKVHKVRMTYHYKRNWRLLVATKEKRPPEIPRAYRQAGVNIIDLEKDQKQYERQHEGYFDWVPDHPSFIQSITSGPGHPLYKEIPCRVFDSTCQLSEGVEHAQVLTKTIVYKGQPELWKAAEEEVDQHRIPEEDERVRRYIMQSVRWDPTEDLILPKRKSKPQVYYPNYFGIPVRKANETLANNLLRLMEMTFSDNPDNIERRVVKNALSLVAVDPRTETDQRVLLRVNNDLMITTPKALPNFATVDQVMQTKDIQLPSIYPIKYTLDLKEKNEYEWENRYPFLPEFPHRFPHTLFVLHTATSLKQWSLAQKHAKAIVHCHGTLAALARQLFGDDVKDLPRPLSVQCILSDNGRKFTFYAYQLNTLDLAKTDGIKNQAWIDSLIRREQVEEEVTETEHPYAMFTLADQLEGLLGYQRYDPNKPDIRIRTLNTYDPIVMKKMLSLYSVDLGKPSESMTINLPQIEKVSASA